MPASDVFPDIIPNLITDLSTCIFSKTARITRHRFPVNCCCGQAAVAIVGKVGRYPAISPTPV
jgi:hypothetical protein